MNILFYFGHPSQYLFLKNVIRILRSDGITCEILIKSKDVLESLLIEDKESYVNILPEGRKRGKLGELIGLLKRDLRLFRHVCRKKYNLFLGTDPSLAHIGFLRNIPVITVLEDDIDIVAELARITFPFTSVLLTPHGCKMGRYERKTVHYHGYMKLAYLHPKYFSKKDSLIKQPYFLFRLSRLDAYHDSGKKGFSIKIIKEIIDILERKGDVYISSEGEIDASLAPYELRINPNHMHQVLANTKMLISDSQSMTMEAAMLGIPSIRFSDFAGRISVLEELEKKYFLTYGIPTESAGKLMEKLDELLAIDNLEQEFQNRRFKMLNDKIDVTAFLVWFIENYPESKEMAKSKSNIKDLDK